MRLFAPLYDQTLRWARHSRAPWALSVLSFAESIIFPVPTDVMLAPMVLAQPLKWLHYAALATVFSVLGGVFGYLLGAWAFDWASAWLLVNDGNQVFAEAQRLFQEWGVWFVFIAAFTPVPYKVLQLVPASWRWRWCLSLSPRQWVGPHDSSSSLALCAGWVPDTSLGCAVT